MTFLGPMLLSIYCMPLSNRSPKGNWLTITNTRLALHISVHRATHASISNRFNQATSGQGVSENVSSTSRLQLCVLSLPNKSCCVRRLNQNHKVKSNRIQWSHCHAMWPTSKSTEPFTLASCGVCTAWTANHSNSETQEWQGARAAPSLQRRFHADSMMSRYLQSILILGLGCRKQRVDRFKTLPILRDAAMLHYLE